MLPQVKSYQVYSNGSFTSLLEICRKGQWSFSDAWSNHSNRKLRFVRNNFTTTILIGEKTMTPEAEKFNGWAAMLGFVAAIGAYATTGQIVPGIF